MPGLGTVLGARMLGEVGDDRERFTDARGLQAFAGTAPVTRASGTKRIVLARTERGYVAFDDRCTHRGGSLAGGVMICGTVQCLWHGSQFDAATGQVKAGPAKTPINVYQVTEERDEIKLKL